MILHGIDPDKRQDGDYSTAESYDQVLELINEEIQKVNLAINLFSSNVRNRDLYVSNSAPATSTRKEVTLTPLSDKADINFGRGPYRIGPTDFLTLGANLRVLPGSSGLVRATRQWGLTAGDIYQPIEGGLSLRLSLDNPLRVEDVVIPAFPLGTEEQVVEVLNSQVQSRPISFLFEDGILVIEPGEDVISVKVVGGVLKSLLQFPKKTSINHSALYTTSRELATITNGRSIYNVLHVGNVKVSSEAIVTFPSNIQGKAVLVVEDNFFLINGSEPLSIIAGERIDILSGYDGNAKIYTEGVELKGVSLPLDLVGSGSMAVASPKKLNNKFRVTPSPLLEGDTLEGQSIKVIFSEDGIIHTNFNTGGGEDLIFLPSEYSIALEVLSTLAPTPTLEGALEGIRDLNNKSVEVASAEEDISRLELAYKKLKSTHNYTSFTLALSCIREAHLSLGLDRAIDVLYSGDFESYFNLREIEANYASLVAKSTRDVSRRMQSYE
jgi:hypothetical protein